ncbi:probable phosphoribosylformylglycinamidine synthase, chloroplastic/mitochondrial [Rosa chinensis]|uniref:probable phosphoribosylformylglycinamidine synthase, chloroplastic/mitochondrial n=1 Tax=Rosa chinensis TaxID=74649 RepID=UPI000D08E27B|nr:probable phosphoribosylformylglycinamidine synthase, chloroplastic/mitochondrial [Rosa chinensis]
MVGVLLRDLKFGDDGVLLHIDLGCRKVAIRWLCTFLIVNNCPDLEDVSYLKQVFEGVQCLLDDELVSGGHDISYGGLLVYAVKMAFAGNCGINLDERFKDHNPITYLYFVRAFGVSMVVKAAKSTLDY